jgi:hypothetical protein
MDFTKKPGSTQIGANVLEARDSTHHFLFRSSVDLPGHLELDPTLRYVSGIAGPSVPGYVELDSRLGWHPRANVDISVFAQNLLHPHHAEFRELVIRHEFQRSAGLKVLWSF